jgi:hypothetical protein
MRAPKHQGEAMTRGTLLALSAIFVGAGFGFGCSNACDELACANCGDEPVTNAACLAFKQEGDSQACQDFMDISPECKE